MSFFFNKKNNQSLPGVYEDLQKNKTSLLVDVRSKEEYMVEHAKGAKNIPLSVITKEVALSLKSYKKIYIICQTGRRSGVAIEILKKEGLEPINIEGGITAWKAENLPTE